MNLPKKPGEGRKEVLAVEELTEENISDIADNIFGDGKSDPCEKKDPVCPFCKRRI